MAPCGSSRSAQWLVSIAAAYATAGLGPKVSSAAYFGVFLASGFAATVFTKAKALLSLTAFLGASLISAATYYLIAMQAVGVFVAVITFVGG